MSDVYLEKLKLKGFRSYRSETEITFAQGPGLTVVVGPNGLGKSTLFDAIEWGLTGELRRLNNMDATAAEKKAALGKKPEVELFFDDSAHIFRGLRTASINKTQFKTISEWLTAEKWRGVSSIADCLQLTHFLGQSSRQMFVHLDGKQRWGLLEGPAGLQSLWKVESALGRKQTDTGFDRVQQAFSQSEAKIKEQIKRIQDLQEKLLTRRDLERADEILAPDEIVRRCERIGSVLAAETGTTTSNQILSETAVPDVDRMLQSQRINLELAEQLLANQRTQLASWVGLAQEYAAALAKQASLRPEREHASHEFGVAATELEAVTIYGKLTHDEHQIAGDRYMAQRAALDVIISEINRNIQIAILDERRELAMRQSDELTAKSNEQERLVTANRSALEILEYQRTRHTELIERGAMLKALAMQAEDFLRDDRLRQTARLELATFPASDEALKASITKKKQALADLELQANALKLQKDAAVAIGSAIAVGVAQIASALREEDCVCPVCQTTFTVVGKLKALASQQANSSDERLVEVDEKILQLSERIRDAQQKIFDLNADLERLQKRREELTKLVFSADHLESRLRGASLLSDLDIDAFLPALATAIAENEQEARGLLVVLSASPDAITVRTEIQRLTNLQQETATQRDQLLTFLVGLEQELGQFRNLPSSGRTTEELQAVASETELALQQAKQAMLEAQSKVHSAHASEASLKGRMLERKARLKELDDQLTDLNATEKELEARWTRQGYENLPLPEIVRRIDETYENRSIRLRYVSQEHAVLLEGRRRYLANAELQQLESNLKAECDQHKAPDVGNLLSKLGTELDEVQKQQTLLSRVREKRTELLNQLRKKATDIRSTVSNPLNANIERFCAALMSDRTHQVSLNAIASATTAQALLSYQPDGKGEPKNPLLYMSEGQLAATSLCLLFGASATYPWSRWKCLLMDDPLHHNDSIHAAAFIDVVRNLIKSQDYQIIVSTHDMEQAGYFLRKCRNAGITARYVHLYGRAENGTALLQNT